MIMTRDEVLKSMMKDIKHQLCNKSYISKKLLQPAGCGKFGFPFKFELVEVSMASKIVSV